MPGFGRQMQQRQAKPVQVLSSKSSAHSSQSQRSSASMRLQPALGNQAMQRVLRRGILQAKLTVNQPGDVFEQEADRVAASMNFGASCGPAKNTLPMVSIQGGGPGDKSKDAPKGGGTPEQSKAGEQTGNKTPDGVSLGPTDPKKAFCLKPGSYSVKTGHVTEPNFAQGVQIIEFEGSDKGNADGKACSCGCGLYRQWISGTLELITPANLAQANTQLVQDLQKKNIKKAPTPEEVLRYAREKAPKITALGSCNNSIPINVSDFSEEYTNCINKSEKGCKRKFVDQPGPDAKLSDGTYINIQLGFKYEVWDACQGKSVQTQGGKLSIEGSKDPRSVIWPTSKITSSPSQPVQRSATSSNAPGPVPPVVNEALLAPGNLLDPRVHPFLNRVSIRILVTYVSTQTSGRPNRLAQSTLKPIRWGVTWFLRRVAMLQRPTPVRSCLHTNWLMLSSRAPQHQSCKGGRYALRPRRKAEKRGRRPKSNRKRASRVSNPTARRILCPWMN